MGENCFSTVGYLLGARQGTLQLLFALCFCFCLGFPGSTEVKRLPAMQETWVQSLGQEDPLEKEMATHSSILAWRIPWTEELGGLQSMGRKESDTTERLYFTSVSALKLLMGTLVSLEGIRYNLTGQVL